MAFHLTQSRYYSPVFNAAVFDGPIRIYFAQHQEPLALKVYFHLQQCLKDSYAAFRKSFKAQGQTIFLMLYPTPESFENSFESGVAMTSVVSERLGDDYVLGVRGPLNDGDFETIFQSVMSILQNPVMTPDLAAPSL